MIKITNGQAVVEVSNGAYESIYKSQGYYPFENGKGPVKSSQEPKKAIEKEEPVEEVEEGNDLLNKPLKNWSKNEVKAFAVENNIDISKTKNVNEAKDIIAEFLGE